MANRGARRQCGSDDAAGPRLGAYKTPDENLFLDPLPKNRISKVHRRALREKLAPAETSQGWQSEFERIAVGAPNTLRAGRSPWVKLEHPFQAHHGRPSKLMRVFGDRRRVKSRRLMAATPPGSGSSTAVSIPMSSSRPPIPLPEG